MNVLEQYPELVGSEIVRNESALQIYLTSRKGGEPHRFAEMCALRSPPGTKNTERAFMQGAWNQMERMDPHNREQILKAAASAGIATQGKCYKGGLGRPNDPAAWVSSAEDVLATARAKNLNVSGVVNHKAVDNLEPPERVALAPDIVDRHVKRIVATEPKTAEAVRKNPKKLNELKERVIAKHGRKK